MPSKTKFLTAMAAIIALLAAASSAQAQRGTVGVIQNRDSAVASATHVAVNETSGDVYVINFDSDGRSDGGVHVYDSSGNFLFKFFDAAGHGFPVADGLAIDQSTGNVYLSEDKTKVQVFNSGGDFLYKFDAMGNNNLAVDSGSGDVYLTAGYFTKGTGGLSAQAALRVYDSSGHFLRSSGWNVDVDNPSTGFEVCTASSGHECSGGAAGAGAGQFGATDPSDARGEVAIDETTGSAYAVDPTNNRVQVFDFSGNYKFQFGSLGSGNGQFSGPTSISLDQATGDVTVLDKGNDRIETFDSSGSYKSQFVLPAGTGGGEFGPRVPDFAFDYAKSRLYLIDAQNERVQALDPVTGKFLFAFGQGVDQTTEADTCTASSGDTCGTGTNITDVLGLAVNDTSGDLYAVGGGEVFVYGEDGSFLRRFGIPGGSGAGHLIAPGGISIDQATGAVYVLEPRSNRVSKFDSAGNFLFSFGWDVNQTQAGGGLEVCPRSGKPGDICQAGEPGPEPGQIGGAPETSARTSPMEASGIAVSPEGNVYVSEPGYWEAANGVYYGNRRVQVFGPNGSLISTFPVPHDPPGCLPGGLHDCFDNAEPYRLAVDSAGRILTAPSPLGVAPTGTCGTGSQGAGVRPCQLKQFSGAGEYMGPFASESTFGRLFDVAIDASNDHASVYQASNPEEQQYEVAVYDSAGALVEQVGLGLPKPSTKSSGALAVRSGSSRAYVSDNRQRIFILDTLATLPAATINSPSNVTSSAASFSGSANLNTNAFGGGYHFEYRPVGATAWKEVASEVPLSPGTSPVSASQGISDLEPNTSYQVRLIVTRAFGGGSATSAIQSFTTGAEAPRISLVDASPVTDTTATLKAYIDPRKSHTTYYFEYGPDESYGTVVPLGEDGEAGSKLGPEGVLERIEGLQPSTTYHFRVTATNQAGPVHSSDTSFTTRATAEMNWPARALELVNEPEKGNQNTILVREEPSSEGGVLGVPGINRAGNRAAWLTFSGAPGSTTGAAAPFLSERTEAGWVTRPLTPAASEQPGEGMREYERPVAATPDLSTFAFLTTHGILSAAEQALVRVHASPNGLHHQIIETQPVGTKFGLGDIAMAADGTMIYSRGRGQEGKGQDIFIVGADGVPEELPTPACEATLLTGAKESFSRLLLLSAGDTNCNGPKQLYSLEPDSGALEPISGPPSSGPAAAVDQTAARISDDGSTVIYRTATAISGDDANGITDLYRWQAGSGNECLTCAAGGLGASSTHTSKDLSHIYINTASQLVPGTPGGLYVWRDGEIHFISPNPDAGMDLLTPDGRTMVFWAGVKGITSDRLDACVNIDPKTHQDSSHESTNPCSQLYLYSEARGTIECISCPEEPQEVGAQPHLGGGFGVINYALAEDGQTVGFVTEAALSPRDINNTLDVYEWHNGSVRLVTNGASEWPESLFARPQIGGISADGRDLEIAVGGAALSGHEADGFVNIYDARVGGGFPVKLPPAPCVEDACQGPLQSPPPLSNPASSNFNGQGNAAARHAKRHRKAKQKKKHSRRSKQRRGANHNRGGAK